jgi:lipase maturation factor 1
LNAERRVTRVDSPPEKPVMVFDGDCNFCTRWIRRWERMTRDRIEYIPFQDPNTSRRFPAIPREQFEESVQLIETDGRVLHGAAAVFRSLSHREDSRGLLWRAYRTIPPFALASEAVYRFVARHRPAFSRITRWILGPRRS